MNAITSKLGAWLLGALFLGTSACGSNNLNNGTIDAEFAPYVERFQQMAMNSNVAVSMNSLSVIFGQPSGARQNAVCLTHTLSFEKKILIRTSTWEEMDELAREALIFHELGHCLLGRPHTSAVDAHGIPLSMMSPWTMSSSTYSARREDYLSELFHRQY